MKKICLGLFLLVGLWAWADENPVRNASFEVLSARSFPEEWSGNTKVYSVDTEVARTGKHSLKWSENDPERYCLCSQHADVKPGKSYIVSAWVKTQDVKNGQATLCMEWSDTQGKWLGGAYAHGCTGTNDWTRIETLADVPAEAGRCSITCYGKQATVGTAWFDDVEIREYFPSLFQAIVTDRYRNQTLGGEVRVCVGVNVRRYTSFSADKIVLHVRQGDRKITTAQPVKLENGVVEFQLDTTPLAVGEYTLSCEAKNPERDRMETISISMKKLEKFPERKAYIDEHRRLILDGKPFFPLGLYFHYPQAEDIDRLAASKFNCIMPYPALRWETLDQLYAKGIRTIYSVKDYYAGLHVKTDAEGIERTKAKVAEMKSHPGIMAWYINDELPLTMLAELSARRDLMESLDPGRPTWAVLYQINQMRSYLPTFDIAGTDPYPIPGKPIGMAWDWSRRTNEAGFGLRAVWQVPQIFNWGNYRKTAAEKAASKAPTYEEMRAMVWMNIAGGANGIICYSYYDLFRNDVQKEDDAATQQAKFEKRWGEVSQIAEEVSEKIPVLLSVEKPLALVPAEDSSPDVAWRTYAMDGTTYLLVVNTVREPRKAVFTGAASPISLELQPLEPRWVVLDK
ncbi:MAG: hypothetical protein Q4D98_09470 [Planctomycetia bacterium]|nr:hypothetical protein [Planctomycetia bacterium]